MNFEATANNVILKVTNKIKNPGELLIDTGTQDAILIGEIVAVGYNCNCKHLLENKHSACAYANRVAVLPWTTDTETYYAVKEENIYGIVVE